MKTTIKSLGAVILGGGLFISGCAKKQMTSFQSLKNPEVAAQLKSFVAEKEAQANAATNQMPSEFKSFFAAAAKGDWLAVSNAFVEFRKHAGQYEHSGKTDERLRGTAWQAVLETWGALDAFGEGDEKYSAAFGNDIIDSIPPGSIYFGGTDPGRFLITAMQKSHVNGDPFFTLTQNALADSTYLDYLRGMYGDEDLHSHGRRFAKMLPGLHAGCRPAAEQNISSSPVKTLPSARTAKSRSAARWP